MDVTAIAAAAGAGPALPPPKVALPTPDDLVLERFSNVMNAAPAPGLEPGDPPVRVRPASHVGDAILDVIRGQSRGLQVSWKTVQDVLTSRNLMSVNEMFRMQAAMIDLGLRMEVVGKGVSKAIQSLDQTVKMQ